MRSHLKRVLVIQCTLENNKNKKKLAKDSLSYWIKESLSVYLYSNGKKL